MDITIYSKVGARDPARMLSVLYHFSSLFVNRHLASFFVQRYTF